MKKIVMATLLAATAFASQAQVTISGKGSIWMDNTKVGSVSSTSQVIEPTSNIAFKAVENLGNGIQARGVLETSLQGNTYYGVGTQLGDRQGTVGLATAYGSIDLGRNVHSQFLAVSNNDAFSTLYGSVAGDVQNFRGLRFSNGVYVAANVSKDVVATYDRTQNGVGTEAEAVGLSGTIAGVNATVSEFKQGKEKSTVVGANYKMGAAQLFASRSDDQGIAKSVGTLVGAKYQTGPFVVKASYGKTNTNIKAYALGTDYVLSKRTEIGIAYRNVDAVGSAHDIRQVGVGLTHRF